MEESEVGGKRVCVSECLWMREERRKVFEVAGRSRYSLLSLSVVEERGKAERHAGGQ